MLLLSNDRYRCNQTPPCPAGFLSLVRHSNRPIRHGKQKRYGISISATSSKPMTVPSVGPGILACCRVPPPESVFPRAGLFWRPRKLLSVPLLRAAQGWAAQSFVFPRPARLSDVDLLASPLAKQKDEQDRPRPLERQQWHRQLVNWIRLGTSFVSWGNCFFLIDGSRTGVSPGEPMSCAFGVKPRISRKKRKS